MHESGRFAIDGLLVTPPDLANLTQALRRAVEGQTDPTVVIRAATSATHQLVVTAMQAARQAGIAKVQFATQAGD